MKNIGFLSILGAASLLLAGCGKSSTSTSSSADASGSPPPPANTPSGAAAPATAPPAPVASSAPAAPAVPPAAVADNTPAAPAAPAASTASATPDAASLTTLASTQTDPVLKSVGTELADKVNALSQTCSGNPEVKSQLTSSVQSLVAGKDASSLTSFYQTAKSVNLTPQQTQLAKDVGNLASAYVVQKNFSGLQGAQTDVAALVDSLRKGELSAAVPPLEKIAQNANLTSAQKDLLGSVAEKYAPGLTKAAGTLQQGIQSLRNFGK